MFKIHLLATERGQGKTKWLRDQIDKVTNKFSPYWQERNERIVILLPTMRLAQIEHRDIAHKRQPVYWGSFDRLEIPFCGMSKCSAIFIDEYQKLTPEQWHELQYLLYKSNPDDLYLAGDTNFTFDQLCRNPNDTEHLYRRLADQEHEINRLKQRG